MKLFNPINDRSQTMLAYEVNFFPHWDMRRQHQIVWNNLQVLTKAQIVERCNEDLTEMCLPLDPQNPFAIHWLYNNIPTEHEWNKLDNSTIFVADYRISPIIKDGGGRVCLLMRQVDVMERRRFQVPQLS